MPLKTGMRFGSYEILAPLGAGGMGEVYRARDTTLRREVALKVLPDHFASDTDRLARFQREAQVLASLNHPNIAAIYGLEDADGVRALVLELVEGPTLADRRADGPLPRDQALPLAKQIAEALEAAHEHGIVHRDLKPANIKVRADGTVKVLDFGLAKLAPGIPGEAGGPGGADFSQSPTLTTPAATRMGLIMGTAAYMSPEQAAGLPVDKRCDIWALGVVLFEMLTGRRLFTGETVTHVLASVIAKEIDWSALPPNIPGPVRKILRRCLEKDPKRRLRDVREAIIAIDEAVSAPADDTVARTASRVHVGPRGWRQAMPWAIAVAMTAIATVSLWIAARPALPDPIARFVINVPASDLLVFNEAGQSVALSPDGQTFVYAATREGVTRLFRRPLDQIDAVAIPGTENGVFPTFSPDGEWIAFSQGGTLKKIALAGGPPVTLHQGAPGKPVTTSSWGSDGNLVFGLQGVGDSVMQVSAAGGEAAPVTTLDADAGESDHRWPALLPDGKAVLFTVWPRNGGLDTAQVAVATLTTGERRLLLPGSYPRYVPTGHIVFARTDALWAVPFDVGRLAISGQARPILEGVQVGVQGMAEFAVAGNGSVAYVPGRPSQGRTLVWVGQDGRTEAVAAPPRLYNTPRLSPDGARVAVAVADAGPGDVWIYELRRGTLERLTFDSASETDPVWTPDGSRIAYYADGREGGPGVFWQRADGTGAAERLTTGDRRPLSWSPDGKRLTFIDLASATKTNDLGEISPGGDPAERVLLGSRANESNAAVSPDGRWLAIETDETGRTEIFVRPFPDVETGRTRISLEGGDDPVWAPDGSRLFYRAGQTMMAVAVTDGPPSTWGAPEKLFEGPYVFGLPRHFDIARDGRRFLMMAQDPGAAEGSRLSQIVFVQHWVEELKRLVPRN